MNVVVKWEIFLRKIVETLKGKEGKFRKWDDI